MKARTATLLSVAGVLTASSVAAVVNAQVFDTDDDSRTLVPVPGTSTATVESLSPTSTIVVDVSTSAGPVLLAVDTTPLPTDTTATAAVTTVPAQTTSPVNASPIAPIATEASGQTAIPGPSQSTPGSGTIDDGHTVDHDDDAAEDRDGEHRGGDDD